MNVASAERNLTISPGTRNSYPLSGVRLLSARVFCSSAKKSFFFIFARKASYESSSRIFCSQREARVKFINKIDSELAWMTRVLEENF